MTAPSQIDPQAARVTAYSALAIAVLFLPSLWNGVAHPLPGPSDSEIAAFLGANRTAALFAAELSAIGFGGLLIVFGSGLWSILRRAEGGSGLWSAVTFAACTATAVTILAVTTLLIALVHMAPNLDRASLPLLYDTVLVANLATAFPNTVYPIAAAKVILETRVLPAWVAYGGFLVALTHFGSSMSLAREGLLSPGGLLPSLAPVTHFLWLIAVAVALLRRQRVTRERV